MKVTTPLAYILKKINNWYFIAWGYQKNSCKKINFNDPAIDYLNKKTIVINSDSFNADLMNKLNSFKKKKKINFDFIIHKRQKKS